MRLRGIVIGTSVALVLWSLAGLIVAILLETQ